MVDGTIETKTLVPRVVWRVMVGENMVNFSVKALLKWFFFDVNWKN
jgi:hypothetical protein